ncbi:hypothetical protein EIP91_007167 [Steccherinum ochraceum]|uniref:Uncharacterized protein n=1 Tax=Steccherinum ochraceum TaxID=92696 RepID=A0A4R0RQR6_9APHY|nr:hypothetical protein EIP91_007167 [Steccherinum ochraceum]
MEPTSRNADRVLSAPPALLPDLMAKVMDKLRDGGTSRNFIHTYVGSLTDHWRREMPRGQRRAKWSALQQACVDAGYVGTVAALTRNTRKDIEIASHKCISALIPLVKCASRAQRRMIFDQMKEHRLLDICLDKAQNHPLLLHRSAAKEVIRTMCADLFLGETLSPSETGDLIEKLLDMVLEGPERICTELLNPEKTWQSQMILGRFNIPPLVASKYGNRYYAITQENCMFAIHGLIGRHPKPSRRFFLDLLQAKPVIIDKLLDCANLPLPEWYPETEVDGIACEILALMFQFPLRSIPGFLLPIEGATKKEREEEHEATISALKILISRDNWRSKLLGIWNKIQQTSYDDIFELFNVAKDEYYATELADEHTFEKAAENRGRCRIVLLRLLTNLTFVEELPNEDILSFLRVAYLATSKWQMMDIDSDIRDRLLFFERGEEICRSPLYVVECDIDADPTGQVPQETTMGPIAMIRLLTRLAERGILDQAQTWTEVPPGCDPSIQLPPIKQITSPAVVNKLLSLSVKRVKKRRELGAARAPRGDHWHTRSAYIPAAELAMDLLKFDEVTNGRFSASVKGARKELALCLDLAAETSVTLRQHEAALGFSLGAIAAVDEASEADGIPRNPIRRTTSTGYMEPKASNVARILNAPPALLPDLMTKVMIKLREGKTSRNFIHLYIGSLNERWNADASSENAGGIGWTALQQACVDAGFVEAMAILTQNDRKDIEIATSECLCAFSPLIKLATLSQRRLLFDQMMQYKLLDICVEKAQSHKLSLHRAASIALIRGMSGKLFLAESLSPQETAVLIGHPLDWTLEGPDRICAELLDPEMTWQSQMMIGKYNVPPPAASKYGKRYYGSMQENCIWSILGLVGHHPVSTREFFLQMLQANPVIVDQLLSCAGAPLPEWYPESDVDGAAAEVLAAIFQFPLWSLPGFPPPTEGNVKKMQDTEYEATISALRIFVTRPNWRSMLLALWLKIERTSYTDIFRLLEVAKHDYFATVLPDAHSYKVQDADDSADIKEYLLSIERGEEVARSPIYVHDCKIDVDAPVQIPEENTIGPIAMIRLLTCLAERCLLEQAQTWTKLPAGCDPSTSLAQIKQITSPAVVKKLLSFCTKRVTARRKLGRSLEPNHWQSRSAYIPAAELASELLKFNDTTNKKFADSIKHARKELALCLDRAAEASMRAKEYETALGFFLGAIAAITAASAADEIPADLSASIQRRIADAKRRIDN